MKRRRRGLTLIELLVVIVIIGILTVVAIPNFLTARESARLRACAENMKMIETAVEQYAIHNHLSGDQSPPTVEQLFLAGYFRTMPVCPSGGHYSIEGNINAYVIECDIHGKLNELMGNL